MLLHASTWMSLSIDVHGSPSGVDSVLPYVLVSWLKGGSLCTYISHVARVSDTAQVTRQVSLLGLIE